MAYCGCGSELQSNNNLQAGYISKLQDNSHFYCWRCFRIKHYNELVNINNPNYNYNDLFMKIKNNDGVVFISLTSWAGLFGSLIWKYHYQLKNLRFYIIINKIDTIMQYIAFNKLKDCVRKQITLIGLEPIDIILVSTTKNILLMNLLNF
ncbi:hypothetical protein [Spiroplasma endosymbiont of Agriotes lineatus]|uniref:hypothetical protein n=1 Tax=Spiroplasma endosymbiont of Agriotes lineatus TaxID=3077930 RepID=UPI0030D035CB